MSIRYRRAVPGDAAAIAALVERSYAHYVPLIGLRPAPMDADYASVVERQIVWVGESEGVDGTLVGVIVLALEADQLSIDNVAVAPNWQGRGVGSRLLDIAEDEARAGGRTELHLFTHVMMTDNIAYYTRRGYVETHRLAERAFERAFFTKRLDSATAAPAVSPVVVPRDSRAQR